MHQYYRTLENISDIERILQDALDQHTAERLIAEGFSALKPATRRAKAITKAVDSIRNEIETLLAS